MLKPEALARGRGSSQLMAAGLSNQEIAKRLIIALGTVKAYTSSNYRKLGVRGRTQAVVRAQELDLL